MILTIFSIIVLIFSIILHEISHGYMAEYLGDPTARILGRLTLNPIPHIDPMGSIVLPLLFVLSGSPVLFGWAKPVPYDPRNIRGSALKERYGGARMRFGAFLRKMENAGGWTAGANAIVLGLFGLMMFFFATEKGVSAGLHIAACAVLIPVTIWLYIGRIKHVVA